jgi:ATP-dependent phosphofructokinase / diphosphate-dependent phosphofructokinase
LRYVPFRELVNPETMITEVRFVNPGSDFHRLARFLETRVDPRGFDIGRRPER